MTITNESPQDVTLPDGGLCLESVASPSTPCAEGYDWGESWFDRTSRKGPFTLRPGESRVLHGQATAFLEPKMLTPLDYRLRVRLVSTDVASSPFTYRVDDPKGENRAVWEVFRKLPQDISSFTVPYYHDFRVRAVLEAHPHSDYARIAAYETGLPRLHGLPDVLKFDESYAALHLPEAFDTELQIRIARIHHELAMEYARRGALDDGERESEQARALLDQLSVRSPYSRAVAKAIASDGYWSRAELELYGQVARGEVHDPIRPIEPRLDCVMLNNDGTFTAWFGYANPNGGILRIPVGPQNMFAPGAAERGQVIDFDQASRARAFHLTAPVGTILKWTLDGRTVEASIASPACKSGEGEEKAKQ